MAITRLNNNSVTSVSALPNLASLPSGIPTGKVLQVITTGFMSTFTLGSATTTDITGSTLNITPSSTSSKILCTVGGSTYKNATNSWHYVKLWRDSTQLQNFQLGGYADSGQETHPLAIWYLDSPATTSQVSYFLKAQNSYATNINYNPNLTIYEIGA